MGNASAGGLAYVTQGGGAGGGVGVVIGGNTAGATASVSSGTLVLAGGNNITLSQNGQSITISGGAGGAFSAGVSGGNTSGSTGLTGSQLVLAGGNNITLSQSTGAAGASVTIQGAVGTGTAITGAASITLSSGGISFNGSNLAGVGSTITGRASITMNSAGIAFNGSSLMGATLSTSSTTGVNLNGAANSAGLTLSNPYFTRSIFPQDQLAPLNAPTNASMSIQYVPVDSPLTGTRIDALVGMSFGSSATTNTGAIAFSVYMGISTRNGVSLSSLSSGSTQTTYSYASNTGGQTQLTMSALRPISCPVNFNFAPGEYFVGVNIITATSSIGLSTTNMGLTMSMYGGTNFETSLPYAEITAATATSTNLWGGQGVFTAATTGMPVSVSLAAINQTGASQQQANIALVFRNA